MEISLILSALLVSVFSYLGGVESTPLLGVTGGYYIVGRPLVAGLLCGMAFGDIKSGVLCGLAIQAVFIANLSTGGATNSEITYAAYGGIGLALATTKDPAIAVTLAIFIGQTFGLIFYNTRMAIWSYWNQRAQKAAETNDLKGISRNHVLYPQIFTFLLRAVPIFLAIVLGKGVVQWLLSNIPQKLTDIISVLGGVLPALGIAMLMSIVLKNKIQFVFFFAGFAIMAFAGLSMIALVFLGALVAYLVYLSSGKNDNSKTETPISVSGDTAAFEDDDLF